MSILNYKIWCLVLTLNVAWVHEDPDSSSLRVIKIMNCISKSTKQTLLILMIICSKKRTYHGFRWKVWCELSTDNTSVTMRPSDFAPNATVVWAILLSLCFVDVSHALSLVPVNLLLSVHTFNLDEGSVGILVWLGPENILNS